MQPAIEAPSSYSNRSKGSRLVAALAALVFTALVVLLLLRLGLVNIEPPSGSTAITVDLLPGKKDMQATKAPAAAKQSQPHKAEPRETKSSAIPPPIVPPPAAATKSAPWNVIWMSHDQMVAADISNLPSHHAESAAASGEASADASGAAGGAGGPPGPDHLFDAAWYRRPSQAEMATYMPHMSQPGWGMVACKTAPDYRVEDCRELDESPGSHLARAVREAAWQFKVLPPRVNGKPMIGAWVRIRFDVDLSGGAAAN